MTFLSASDRYVAAPAVVKPPSGAAIKGQAPVVSTWSVSASRHGRRRRPQCMRSDATSSDNADPPPPDRHKATLAPHSAGVESARRARACTPSKKQDRHNQSLRDRTTVTAALSAPPAQRAHGGRTPPTRAPIGACTGAPPPSLSLESPPPPPPTPTPPPQEPVDPRDLPPAPS